MYAGGVQNKERCFGNKTCKLANIIDYVPNDQFNAVTYENDIALLKLGPFTPRIPPIKTEYISAIPIDYTSDSLPGIVNSMLEFQLLKSHFVVINTV